MADIFKAYQFLNKALGLSLTGQQMSRAEMMFKVQLAKQQGFSLKGNQANNVEACFKNGCADYVNKPINNAELITKVRSVLGEPTQ